MATTSTTGFESVDVQRTAEPERHTSRRLKLGIAAAAVALVIGVGAVVAVNAGSDSSPAPPSSASGVATSDGVAGAPATSYDLRLAAMWAEYLEDARPDLFPPEGSRATEEDLLQAERFASD